MKSIHVFLAYLTVMGFVIRGLWAFSESAMLQRKWVRVLPHLVDTLLLTLGVLMAVNLGLSFTSGWLAAKMFGLLAYIALGVVTLRTSNNSLRLAAFLASLLAAGYIFAVAFSRSPWPWE